MIRQDVRFALRQLWKSPGFALTAIITLALGIGASTAVYTLFDQVLIRSLPVHDPKQLVLLHYSGSDTGSLTSRGGQEGDYFSYPMYRNIRDRNAVFAGVIASDQTQVAVQWRGTPSLAVAELVSGNYFDVLGVQAARGRLFLQADDEAPERNPVVVLSYAAWQGRFGADPRVLNQTLVINAHPFTVIGVSQPGFRSVVTGNDPDLFVPMMMKAQMTPEWNDLDNPRSRWLQIIARLKPSLSRAQAEAGIDVLWKALRAEELKSISIRSQSWVLGFVQNSHLSLVDASTGFSPLRSRITTPLLIMAGMVFLLMVIACANVAILLLVRSNSRLREVSVRQALGANRARIKQQLLVEGLVLGLAGGSLGIFLAPGIVGLLLNKLFVTSVTSSQPFASRPDARVMVFNFVVAVAVGLIFSTASVGRFRGADIGSALKQQRTTVGGRQLRLQRLFVATQIGVSLVLLIAAALLVRSIQNLRETNLGFQTDHLLTFTIDPRLAGYDRKQVPGLNKQILASLSALPGVRSVAATNDPELSNHNVGGNITIAGYRGSDNENFNIEWPRITSNYLATLNVPLIVGRSFAISDERPDAPKVAIVNQAFARKWLGGPSHAIGRHFGIGGGDVRTDIEIIGVAADSKHTNIRDAILPTAYLPLEQAPDVIDTVTYYVRLAGNPDAAAQYVRTAMQSIDSTLVLNALRSMDQQIETILTTENATAFLAKSFGSLAAILSAVGLYGVLAYSASQRTREIGIRMAVGATPMSVIRMFSVEILKLIGVSITVALPLAYWGSRYLGAQLFGIAHPDPLILGQAISLIVLVAVSSGLVPVLRAARVHPTQALRCE